jgi:guanosine-3',5'-bis(diphosphate) 3'-pyrophosphohydrolase
MELSKFTEAISFAARKHGHQKRKGKSGMPYINHPLDVADILCSIGGITDIRVLVAAVLHDTLEDTDTTPEELKLLFGEDVANLVQEVSDDKSLPRHVRKQLQIEHAPQLSLGAKLIKIADKISNVKDLVGEPPVEWDAKKIEEYIVFARKVVDGARGVNIKLENYFEGVALAAEESISG